MKWSTIQYARTNRSGIDIVLSSEHPGIGPGRVRFAFKNNAHLKITKNEHVVLANEGTRIYFKEGDPTEGFKVTSFNKTKTNCSIRICDEVVKAIGTRIPFGDYRLQYDTVLKLYYIDGLNRVKN